MKMMKLDKGKLKDVELDMLKELKKSMDEEMMSDNYSEDEDMEMSEESEELEDDLELPGEELVEEASEMMDEMPFEEDEMGKLVVKTDDPELLQKIKDMLLEGK